MKYESITVYRMYQAGAGKIQFEYTAPYTLPVTPQSFAALRSDLNPGLTIYFNTGKHRNSIVDSCPPWINNGETPEMMGTEITRFSLC